MNRFVGANALKYVARSFSSGRVRIGGVELPLKEEGDPKLIPKGYLQQLDDESVDHLRWMAQKWLLGQDMFLIG